MKNLIFIIACSLISCTQNHLPVKNVLFTVNSKEGQYQNYNLGSLGFADTSMVHAVQLSDNHTFGFTVEANVEPSTYYYLKIKVKSKEYTVNLAAEPGWSEWIGSKYPTFIDNSKEWYYIHLFIKTPDTITNGKLKIYAYNWAKETCFIDSLQITEFKDFPYEDSLPYFIFNPLTYDILNELAFYRKNANEKNYAGLLDNKMLDIVFQNQGITKDQYKDELKRRIRIYGITAVLNEVKTNAILFKNPCVNTKPRETYETKLTGYTDKIVYTQGEIIKVKLQNAAHLKSVQILKPVDSYKFRKITAINVSNNNNVITIATDTLSPGIYCVQLKDETTTFNVPVIINSKSVSKLIVLAPVTTWQAYNYYKGKCFYVNTKDDSCVYHISTQRPLVSCLFDSLLVGHDLFVFNNVYKFFYEKYGCNVYPDYYLEAHPELFKEANTIVFAQHCEYFSTKMFDMLSDFSSTKNIICLGGNQAYYKIQFSNNYQTVECRKDGTFLDNTLIPAGNWRTSYSNEAKYWGNAFTDAGYETYCSYKVKSAGHWIFKNCAVKNEDEFGKSGIDNRGLSGDEMDKMNNNSSPHTILLAKGTNPDNGGGEIVITENKNNGILSFGSIACGSGLYKDKVFTQMIMNFMNKYFQK